MARGLREAFVLDTSALISLGTIGMIGKTLSIFDIVFSPSVLRELEDFAKFKDAFGRAAKEVLSHKKEFTIAKADIKETLAYIEATDNELYNLARQKSLGLITDDIKFSRQVDAKVDVRFSTFILLALVVSGHIARQEALDLLNGLRDSRNWGNNIIYTISKKQLEDLKK